MSALASNGDIKAVGSFTYESVGQKLRFQSIENQPTSTSIGVDLLMFFEEGIFYEINSKNQSCVKKKLQMTSHPLDIPDDAVFLIRMNTGAPSIEGEGLKLNLWGGKLQKLKDGVDGSYTISVTMRCLPLNTFYFVENTSLIFSTFDVVLEIKDPDLLVVPSFCQGKPLEDTPEGTVNGFFHRFM